MNDFFSLHFVLIVLLSFIASTVSTAIGFGLGIILISFLQFLLPPVQLVGLCIIVSITNAIMRVTETRRINTNGKSLRLVLPGVLMIPAGMLLLLLADAVFLKRFFSVIILAASMLLLVKSNKPSESKMETKWARIMQIASGALGGFMGGSSTMSGPPIVLCSLIQHWDKMATHAVFCRYFLATNIASAIALVVAGRYEVRTIMFGLCVAPVVWLGFVAGIWLRNKISQQQFRRYTMICLIVLAVGGFINTFYLAS